MNIPKFFSRLFTVSKHADPAVAAIETPVIETANAIIAPAVAHISDPLAELEQAVEAAADAYAVKIGGGAGVALTPVLNMGLEFGFQAAQHALAGKLGGEPQTSPTEPQTAAA